jgi:excisionase family DNA binding protein
MDDSVVQGIEPPMSRTDTQFMTVPQAAELLNVAPRTVHNWIKKGTVPYVELPGGDDGRRQYRIPIQALLDTLSGNYDVRAHLAEQTARAREARESEA